MPQLEILPEQTLRHVYTHAALRHSVAIAMITLFALFLLIVLAGRNIAELEALDQLRVFMMKNFHFFRLRFDEVENLSPGLGQEYFLTLCAASVSTVTFSAHYLLRLLQFLRLRRLQAQVKVANWAVYFFYLISLLVLLRQWFIAPVGVTDGRAEGLRQLMVGPEFVFFALLTSYGVIPALSIPILLFVCNGNTK